ncbi:MAG: SPOR domain-containing protein [Rhodobacteraceae bacterium]|nr:MAG: SPOR domain-containing protein [Paracoccaceae bacterium]
MGAVLSVALIIGAGAWMWQMIQRDVAGVPVVRALEGPVRVAPDDPGGRQAAHQGLAVNGLAGANEEAPRDQITLAPPPLSLSDADMATPSPHADTRDLTAGDEMQPIPAALPRETDAGAPAPGSDAPALGIKDPTQRAVAQSPRPTPRHGATGSQTRASAPAPSQPSASSSSDSDDLVASVAESVEASISGNRSFDVDPATIGPGTRLVQLGAYDDVAKAQAAWDQLARRFSPLLDDRGRVIEAAHSGGSVFYRLRAHGFSDERDARRFCAALVDQQIDCIPVLIR